MSALSRLPSDPASSAANDNSIQPTNVIQPCNLDSISFLDKLGSKMTITCDQTKSAIQRAAEAIRSEQLVAFPTETVYGLGASALSSKAVSTIFKTKGRPSEFMSHRLKFESFWPGPLTLLIPIPTKSGSNSPLEPELCPISDLVTCGLSTVAVRMPAHAIARALITEAGVPIAAPSANLSGRPSPTTAQHVKDDFKEKVPIILDGGGCLVGVESTVVDGLHSDGRLRILRLGGLSLESIQSCLSHAGLLNQIDGQPTILSAYHQDHNSDFKPVTPGMKYKHYSPSARVILLNPIHPNHNLNHQQDQDVINIHQLISQLDNLNLDQSNQSKSDSNKSNQVFKIGLMMIEGSPLGQEFQRYASHSTTDSSPNNNKIQFINSNLGQIDQPEISAKKLFASLRYLDECMQVDLILVESLPEVGLGKTVMERLRKASGRTSPLLSILLSSSSPPHPH